MNDFSLDVLVTALGGGSLSSETLPAGSLLHSLVWLCSSRSYGSREAIALVWGILPLKGQKPLPGIEGKKEPEKRCD